MTWLILALLTKLHIYVASFSAKPKHYANTPMQYKAIFHGCKKNVNFQMKNYIFFVFFFCSKTFIFGAH